MLYSNNEMVHNETIFGLETAQLKFGRNSLNELGWELSKYNSKKILLVVDPVPVSYTHLTLPTKA